MIKVRKTNNVRRQDALEQSEKWNDAYVNVSGSHSRAYNTRRRKRQRADESLSKFILALVVILIISAFMTARGEASGVINASICNTDKCNARIERLRECIQSADIVQCATDKTMLVSADIIYGELASLLKLATSEPVVWKNDTISLLEQFEGFSPTAYCDNLIYNSKGQYVKHCPTWSERHSIGFWTQATSPQQTIAIKEARRLTTNYLQQTVYGEIENLSCYEDTQKTALADFMYNSGKNTKHNITGIYFIHYVKECNHEVIKGFLNPDNYASKGLKKRRAAQFNLFNQQ